MGSETGISWADSTWNPWQGCRRVSPGCDHCYMHREKERYGQDPARIHLSSDATFGGVKSAKKYKPGSRVFVCSWSDFFLAEADAWRHEAWECIHQRQDLLFLILTKRPENIASRLPPEWPPPNVWLGVTAEDQQRADERIPILLSTPAAGRFVSVEPMLGPVTFANKWPTEYDYRPSGGFWHSFGGRDDGPVRVRDGIRWAICGGESGPHARPMEEQWVRGLRDQCIDAGVRFHYKQKIENGRKIVFPRLDGIVWDGVPALPDATVLPPS